MLASRGWKPLLVLSCIVFAAPSGAKARELLGDAERVSTIGSIAGLNRVTFYPNVNDTEGPEHWVVFYCVDWYQGCQGIRNTYLDFAHSSERSHNAQMLLQLKVRFAEVKCTTDKVLCNEQHIDTYPMVVHYSKGRRVSAWQGNNGNDAKEATRLAKFLGKQMDFSEVQGEKELVFNISPDIWELPAAQQHPLLTAMCVAPYAAAIVGMLATVASASSELLTGLRRLFATRLGCIGQSEELKQTQAEEVRVTGLRSRLPSSWASQRASIEL